MKYPTKLIFLPQSMIDNLSKREEEKVKEDYRKEKNAVILAFCSKSGEVNVENRSFWAV